MALSLSKGSNVSLTKTAPGVQKFNVGLGWDARSTDGKDFDLDAFALLVTEAGTVRNDSDFVFFNNTKSEADAVVYGGDNLTGEGEGDDETIYVNLEAIPADIAKVIIAVSIYEAEERKQVFGQVSNAFVRLVDSSTDNEEVRFDLGEDYSTETAVVFAEIYRNNGEWKFRAIGQGYSSGMAGIATNYGINV
ncbi:MAG: TerD family protein [Enterococcus sp.]|nr:TerD family protein [Enterococcus sp.]